MLELNMTKEQSLIQLDMRKGTLDNLCYTLPPIMQNLKSRVALVLDYSGSMGPLYRDGSMQTLINRLLPIALRFDDDGELDFWIFHNGYHRLPSINKNNFYGYIEREVVKKYRMGATSYAPVMKDVYNKYICEDRQNVPSYVIYITDGANDDKKETTSTITYLADFPIFWQFVGIGKERFEYLQKLDDLKGRTIDNADFFAIKDINDTTDEYLYRKLLTEFPGWLNEIVSRNLFQ